MQVGLQLIVYVSGAEGEQGDVVQGDVQVAHGFAQPDESGIVGNDASVYHLPENDAFGGAFWRIGEVVRAEKQWSGGRTEGNSQCRHLSGVGQMGRVGCTEQVELPGFSVVGRNNQPGVCMSQPRVAIGREAAINFLQYFFS